ncbi:MAG TPA: class I SAM-dependent methyltransferase [Nitrospira sp.]|nr:class I SAM-dependent methyltransferase [Nitrospira sp.]
MLPPSLHAHSTTAKVAHGPARSCVRQAVIDLVSRAAWAIGKRIVEVGTGVLQRCPETVRIRVYQSLVRKVGSSITLEDRREVLREEMCDTIEPTERFLVPRFVSVYGKEQDRYYAYQQPHIAVEFRKGDRVLDVGSGGSPFPHATHLAELYMGGTSHRYGPFRSEGLPVQVCDIGRLPYRNGAFEFVYCSHVLEHVSDPASACEELMRVGKRGYIETPTRMSDIMFNYTHLQDHHRWHINRVGTTLLFMPWEAAERRDTHVNEFFHMAKSKYTNPFQELFRRHRDFFVNMMCWEGRFSYYVIDKEGHLQETNDNTW